MKLLNFSKFWSITFSQDEPTTPVKLFSEFEEIYSVVQKIRHIEAQANMNRKLRGPRKVHVKPFLGNRTLLSFLKNYYPGSFCSETAFPETLSLRHFVLRQLILKEIVIWQFLLNFSLQYGNLTIFLPLNFYVKSILANS